MKSYRLVGSLVSNFEKGFLHKVVWRLKEEGVSKTIQYITQRKSIRIKQQLAEQEVLIKNNHFFDKLGVERVKAEVLLEETKRNIPVIEEDVHVKSQGTQSIHLLAFSVLKLTGLAPNNILEIGTYLGYTTCFLAQLFPEAKIYTVALPSDDPVFENYHKLNRCDVSKVLEQRLSLPNIELIENNSGFLWEEDLPDFELIWLDGSHQFPVVAWDHFYCLSKLALGGWLFSDDIVIPSSDSKTKNDPRFDAYHTVDYYSNRLQGEFEYLLKREDPSLYMYSPKYIAYYKK